MILRPGPAHLFLPALLLAVLALGLLHLRPHPVAAQQAPCIAAINGQQFTNYASSGSAVELRYSENVLLALASNQPLGAVTVRIQAGPYRNEIVPGRVETGRLAWNGVVSLRDHARFGVGLYQVTVSSEAGCSQTAWVNVTGKSAVSTMAGGGASLALLAGVASQLFGFFKAARAGHGRWFSLLGGIPLGLGACVLSQQSGVTPLTLEWAGIWTMPPVAIGGIVQTGISALTGRREDDLYAPPRGDDGRTRAEPPLTRGRPGFGIPRGRRTERVGSARPGDRYEEPTTRPEGRATAPPTYGPPPDRYEPEPVASAPPPVASAPPPTAAPPPAAASPPTARTRSAGSEAPVAAQPAPTAAPPPGDTRDPPRTSYARIECDDTVIAGQEFEVVVGLSATEVAGVAGPALVRPESSVGAYILTVQIVADGFSLREGEHWRHDLPVTADMPYPNVAVHLTPPAQSEPVRPAAIQAIYSVQGQAMGLAVRPVVVLTATGTLYTPQPPPEGVTISLPSDEPAADLTVRIQRGDSESGGRLLWTFDSPHSEVDLPDEAVATDIGKEPERFARQLVDGVGIREGQPGLYTYLIGTGLTVADQMPSEFWQALEAVAAVTRASGGTASLFILSEEPYVPWELAVVDPPIHADPAAPPFLGAQAAVGRWVLGQRRPKLPPPVHGDVATMAVVAGEYNQPGWRRLLEAEIEAQELAAAYGAVAVNAVSPDVLQCLAGTPRADAIHFAVHGIYDPNSVQNGIVLVDGRTLDPLEVKGSMLSAAPFVFLNACQVGSANTLLGDYAGLAEAFLYAGAGGVVAPLWAIKDTIAREIALRFYDQAFAGVPPAELLRRERAAFRQGSDVTSATCLAYIWYGHPSYVLRRHQGDQ